MNIYFFGGYLASQVDVMLWKHSVEKKLPGSLVWAYAWPEGAGAADPVINEDDMQHLAELIVGQNDQIIIVGHSSGCAYANNVAEKVLDLGEKSFKLIALDGFTPNLKLMALSGTVRWSAISPKGTHSRNWLPAKLPNYRVFQADVYSEWPLHFSLVNLNVSDDHATLAEGYWQCDANLEVLGETATAQA